MRVALVLALALSVSVANCTWVQSPPTPVASQAAAPTLPFEDEIKQFEASDALAPPAPGGVVFVGSSSIRLWPDIQTDFPGANVIQRGFGGSELWQVVEYAPRIVLPYSPQRIVVYAGDNDLAAGRTPEQVLRDYQNFVALVRRSLPHTRIAFVSIKPSGSRWSLADKIRKANKLVRDYSSTDPDLVFVDTFNPMLGPDGRPRGELFVADSLHMNVQGYALWRELLAPFVYGRDSDTVKRRN